MPIPLLPSAMEGSGRRVALIAGTAAVYFFTARLGLDLAFVADDEM